MFKMMSALFFVGASLAMMGCSDRTTPNRELVLDMSDQAAIKAQDYHPYNREKSGMRVPPAGSVPRGYAPYRFAQDPEAASSLQNPFVGKVTPEVLATGKLYYERYCLVCHGVTGDGKGPVHEKFNGLVKSLLTEKVRSWSDGRIFHVITAGQGVMGPYESQINNPEWRWAIVSYVRNLQQQSATTQE